jgi:hypothetical protein
MMLRQGFGQGLDQDFFVGRFAQKAKDVSFIL